MTITGLIDQLIYIRDRLVDKKLLVYVDAGEEYGWFDILDMTIDQDLKGEDVLLIRFGDLDYDN